MATELTKTRELLQQATAILSSLIDQPTDQTPPDFPDQRSRHHFRPITYRYKPPADCGYPAVFICSRCLTMQCELREQCPDGCTQRPTHPTKRC